MAPLTWRDTTAPSFQTSVDAQRLAGQSLNNAFGGASDALGKFHEWQQGQAATALANNLSKYPDAASENAARADGTLFDGVDRGNLTPAALGTVNSNASDLLANAAKSQNTTQEATSFARGTTGYNNSQLAEAAAQNASTKGLDLAGIDNAILADPTLQSNPQAMATARARGKELFQSVNQPANSAIAAAAGLSTAIPSQDPGSAPGYTYKGAAFGHESNGNASIVNNTPYTDQNGVYHPNGTGAAGLGQFMPDTADYIRTSHPELGLKPGWQTDSSPAGVTKQNAAFDAFTADNQDYLSKKGIDTNDKNTFMASFLGGAGATKFLRAAQDNPDQDATKVMPAAAAANRGVFYNQDGSPRTLAQVYSVQTAKFSGPSTPGTSAPPPPTDIAGDFYKSMGNALKINSDITGRIGQLEAPGTSGVYGAASRDPVPYATVAANLSTTGALKDIAVNKVQTALDDIRQTGAKYGVDLNGAEAGSILSDSARRDPIWFKSWRDGDNLHINDPAIDAEVKQVASGSREAQLNETTAAKSIAGIVQARQTAASDAFSQLKSAVAIAKQRSLPQSAIQPYYDNYTRAKSQWDDALKSAGNPQFKPKFNTNLTANSPTGTPPAVTGASKASTALSDAAGFRQ